MADASIFSQAVKGGNNPNQDTSTLKGFYEAPNPLFRAMNQQTVTDIQALSDGKVGTFLQRRRIVNGDIATIVNASLDYFLGDKIKNLPPISDTFNQNSATKAFIPIVIKTEFRYDTSTYTVATPVKKPLYIIFDSTPENITFSKSANWTPKEFLGRPEPVWTYNNSSATTFSLNGKFFANNFEAHGRLLKLSDYIMTLVTPSEMNYMPSPVTVFIGEWKQLRCIVNSVQIKYEGPWTVKLENAYDINLNAAQTQEAADLHAVEANNRNINGTVPTHAPYMFEATFNFTIVGKDNYVKYAENIVSSGSNNSSDTLTNDGNFRDALYAINGSMIDLPQTEDTGLYSITSGPQYTYEDGVIKQTVKEAIKYTDSAANLNIYEAANTQRRLSDQGVISNAVSSQMLSLFQKANPSSTNSPASSSSLNPFKKLF